jgi:DNA-binding GntR family transcriptional regulator
MVRENNRFHEAIGAAAGNHYLMSAYRRLLADHERIATILYRHEIDQDDSASQALTIEQHAQIAEAIERRDADAAERVAIEHLDLCREGLSQVLERSRQSLEDIRIDPPRAQTA